MTLLELLIAMSVMGMVVVSLGALANGVQQGFDYTEGHSTATQHARVTLERIARTVREAQANEKFPGALVVTENVGTWSFPDVLVVRNPREAERRAKRRAKRRNITIKVAGPDEWPLVNELFIYCPSLQSPNELLEITMPLYDIRPVAEKEDQTADWPAWIDEIRQSPEREEVTLTELMRTVVLLDPLSGVPRPPRGAVRFADRLTPSKEDWDAYRSGGRAWNNLPWVQGIYGSHTGLRQTWLRIELQLLPGKAAMTSDTAGGRAIPFLGSAALYYELHHDEPTP